MRMAGEIVEEIDHVVGEQGIAGKQAKIGIETSGLDMVVPCADMRVALQVTGFFADDKGSLGVSLEPPDAEGDVSAYALEFRRPVQIALFVKARLDLHHACDLLSLFCRADKRFHKRCIVANPVSGHLNRYRLRVVGSGTDEVFHTRIEALVWVVNEDVSGLDRGKN